MIRRSTFFAAGLFLLLFGVAFTQFASAQTATWTGGGDGATWEDAANWDTSPNLPTANAHIGDNPTPIGLSTDQTINELDLVGDQNAGTATLNHTAGTLTGGGWMKVGVDGGNDGTFTMSGTAAMTGFSQLHAGSRGGTGVINIIDDATFTHTDNLSLAIDDPNGDGTLNISDNGTVNTGNSLNVGIQGTGTVNISDNATLNFQNLNASDGGGTAVINQTGGTVSSNSWVALGKGNTTQPNGGGLTEYNHSAGTLNVAVADSEFLTIGENGPANYNASGTATITSTGGFLVGRNGDADNLGDGLFEITGSNVTISGGDLKVGLDETSADQGAMGELSWIADAGGVSTIVSLDNTELGTNATLTVDLTADSNFSTWSAIGVGTMSEIAILVDNAAAVAGTFAGLAEGASVDIGGGKTAVISYVGGDGNDIVLMAFGNATVLKGDVDLSGSVTFLDINPFINLLSTNGYQAEADCDCDGDVDFLDIAPFITILSSQ